MEYNVKGDWLVDFRQAQMEQKHSHNNCGHGHSHEHIQQKEEVQMINIPILGRIQCVRDIQGMCQLSFIYWYWIYGVCSTFSVVLLPQYNEGRISLVFLLLYGGVALLCISSLFRASTLNPGRTPHPEPGQDVSKWTFCDVCKRKRPPKAHHCRRCKQCVLRMDHHCPWINNCVGEANHWAFMLLILYAFMLSSITFCINMAYFFVYPECTLCDKESFAFQHSRALMTVAVFLSTMMAFGSCALVTGQHVNFLWERTTIDALKDPWPKNLRQVRGWKSIYSDVCGPPPVWTWFFPCKRRDVGNSYNYMQYV